MTISTFPRLSIITVTRNARTALLRTARSIAPLAARLDLEWIVVDGASGDGTRMWLESRDEPWLRSTSEADAGLYDAMNKGIDRARGQFLWFVNAGDEVADAAALAAIIDTCPPDLADRVLFADCLERETDGSLLLKTARDPAWLTYGLFAHHQGMLFGRNAIAGYRYQQRFSIAADFALVARMWRDGIAFERIRGPLAVFERGGASATHALTGLIEQARARHEALGLPLWRVAAIAAAQLAAIAFRRSCPALYDRLRFRRPQTAPA
ncbi:MAG: glycosyltransferase [Geminicoccaceae bacterium]|nr:glycosyltransferase [Geminicoccaceae bacterium]